MAKQNLKNFYNQNAHSGNTMGLVWDDYLDDWVSAAEATKLDDVTNAAKTAQTTAAAADAASQVGNAAGWFSNPKLFKKGGSLDTATGKLPKLFSNLTSPELDYTKKGGLQAYGHNVGNWLTVGKGLYDAYRVFNNIQDIGDAKNISQDLTSDILSAAYSNPTLQYDLAPDQMRLLRELRNGTYDASADVSDVDLLGVLGDAGMGALTGIGGGIPGIVIGALGSGANSVFTDLSEATSRGNSELEALYQAIVESGRQANAMRRQAAMQYAY